LMADLVIIKLKELLYFRCLNFQAIISYTII
jgi:hypothetical protein